MVKSIKEQTNAKLLCVGDDWQSIYRFAGSDISLFSDFESYFGSYHLSKIEKTYRNSNELIDIAGRFVMKNKNQLVKQLVSDKHLDNPIEIIGHTNNKMKALNYCIEKIVKHSGLKTDILLIGRNNFDSQFIKSSPDFIVDGQLIVYKKYPKLKLTFLSAHRSKGIEASHVIIVNGENDKLGFPNKMADDPILSYVLTKADGFDYAEERRLFYVALTRTKEKTYILTSYLNESIFVKELMTSMGIRMNKTLVDKTVNQNLLCPKCQLGHLIERHGKHKAFVGCSNYPSCDYTIASTSVLRDPVPCSCGGYMIKRSGTYGDFYGCSNWPICEEKKMIES